MDMNCRKCNEPWGWFYIRDEVLEDQSLFEKMGKDGGYVKDDGPTDPYEIYSEPVLMTDRLRTKEEMEKAANWQFAPGPYILQCPNCIGKEISLSDADKERNAIASAMADILGDDIDGYMAEMEDLESLF